MSICVVGSGPVGLAFALRLANAGQAVTLIDSGKFASQEQGRKLNHGTIVSAAKAKDRTDPDLLEEGTLYNSRDYMTYSRCLSSGGNAHRWNVASRPSTKGRVRIVAGALADFEARPELGIPAWSASGNEIYGRYDDALAFFNLADHSFNIDNYQDSFHPFPLSTASFHTKLFHFAQADAIRSNRMSEVLAHPGIDVRSDLHLIRIETDKQERVSALVVCNKDKQEIRIKTAHYVLALGGIENSRQLLLAKNEGALSDPHDVFGRWFCDHPHTRLGYLTSHEHEALVDTAAWYDFQDIQGTPIMRGHEIDPEIAKRLELLRFSVDLVGRPFGDCTETGVAIAEAWNASRQRDLKGLIKHLPKLAATPIRSCKLAYEALNNPIHNTGKGGWSDPSERYHSVESLAVEAMFEQRPSPDNRVRLGTKRDRFGRQLPVLQWSWSRQEVDSINRAADLMAEAFHKAGVGSFVTMRSLGQGEIPRAGSGFHHMGGTRQSHDPADGVVNAENRVHGVENLTLIGTSIFPNSVGYANPTLTAVADAMRVADHLAPSKATSVSTLSTRVPEFAG
ncbi:MAG: GMC oxidoreductase [Cyanobacteria bacterium P01_H01_bin.105]